MIYQNEDVYEGAFKDGKKHGIGSMKFIDGNVHQGIWKNDELSQLKLNDDYEKSLEIQKKIFESKYNKHELKNPVFPGDNDRYEAIQEVIDDFNKQFTDQIKEQIQAIEQLPDYVQS